MADYPTTGISYDSRRKPINGHVVDFAADGTALTRNLYSATPYSLLAVHTWLTTTEKDAIETFYDEQKNNVFDLAWPEDGADYAVSFAAPPFSQKGSGGWWRVECQLVGQKGTAPPVANPPSGGGGDGR